MNEKFYYEGVECMKNLREKALEVHKNPEEQIVIPEGIDRVKFESELAIVIGKQTKMVPESEALNYVFGYTVGNDVTAPQFFHEDGHWTIGKSFDTFTPLGPVIETELDTFRIHVEAKLNGVKKQDSSTELMIISIRKMISYLSSVMTLKPGDVLLTGSPVGADFVQAGDVIECEMKGIGTLKNTVVAAKKRVNTL
jgi:2-keto-4-pentenoate hydratase/2-oxohepta-3-ene-1,7-dioic acid hydratase in catechol pathway